MVEIAAIREDYKNWTINYIGLIHNEHNAADRLTK
jgi:hypothetical protein